jgi:hypothetical protein
MENNHLRFQHPLPRYYQNQNRCQTLREAPPGLRLQLALLQLLKLLKIQKGFLLLMMDRQHQWLR